MKTESFSKRLERLRKAKGLTRKKMADLIDMKESTYKDAELGAIPRKFPETLLKICKVLDVTPAILLGVFPSTSAAAISTAEKIKNLSDQLIKQVSDLR